MVVGSLLWKLEPLTYVYIDALYQSPYLCPFLFFIMRFPEEGNIDKFRKEALTEVSEDDVTEFILGVGANEAIDMVSRLVNKVTLSDVEGLEEFILSLEEHAYYK